MEQLDDRALTPHELGRLLAPAYAAHEHALGRPELSVVAPVYDELENVLPLHTAIERALGETLRWELVLVDDGSTDGSFDRMRLLTHMDARVRALRFAHNRGQSAAMCAGMRAARGRWIATLDADLQNDPADLPAMLRRAVEAGVDAVAGYRVGRKDSTWRRFSSRVANAIRNRLTGDRVIDTGCSLKVFRRDAALSIPWFTGMHRFLPTLLRHQGYRVVEHPVAHHPRTWGRSKYGAWNRALPALHDLLAVRWMRKRTITIPLEAAVEGSHPPTPPAAVEASPSSPRSKEMAGAKR